MQRKNILLIVGIAALLLIGSVLAYMYLDKTDVKDTGNLQQDDFTLTYSYLGDSKWEYTVEGTLPTPCYNVTTDAIVMESYPEQVKVTVKVEQNSTEDMCIMVIQEYTYSGTFSASEIANISLVVE